MEVIRGIQNIKPHHRGCVATIGNFDGVHLGHQAVIDLARPHGTLGVVAYLSSVDLYPMAHATVVRYGPLSNPST